MASAGPHLGCLVLLHCTSAGFSPPSSQLRSSKVSLQSPALSLSIAARDPDQKRRSNMQTTKARWQEMQPL